MSDGEYKDLVQCTNEGDEITMLKCLRYGIARQLQETASGRDMAALAKQFVDITDRISRLEKAKPNPNRRTALNDARKKRKKKAPPKRKPGSSDKGGV